jgi:hypothetical protein
MDFGLESMLSNKADIINRMIQSTFIIEFGIVKAIPAKGIVTVETSVAKSVDSIVVTDCILASTVNKSLAVDIIPQIDDKVIVFFPKNFSPEMFSAENNEPIITDIPKGYNLFCGIAVLFNQFITADNKNFLTIDSGKISLNIAYSEDKSANLLMLSTNEKGEVSLKSNSVAVDIKEDNSVTIDTSKATVSIDTDGNVTINSMGGKLSLKNDSADLYTILSGMLQILNSSLTTAGSPASHTVNPNQFKTQSDSLDKLMQ